MTKAERIFNQTRYETLRHIEQWGYDNAIDGGWGGGWITVTVDCPDGELIHKRTHNALAKLLEAKADHIRRCSQFNLWTTDKLDLELKIFQMMCKTHNNTRID